MGGFLLRKAGAALIVLFLASVLVFAGVRALPGDPALALGAEARDPAVLAGHPREVRARRAGARAVREVGGNALQGDLGVDSRQLPVAETIVSRIPITLELAGLSILIGMLIGIPAGVIAAVRRGKASDYASTSVGARRPLATELLARPDADHRVRRRAELAPCRRLRPVLRGPVANLQHLLLPAIVLGTGLSAVLMRQMRSSMLDSLSADYVRTARAKGLSEWRVVGVHAFRNSLITVTTVIGLQLGALISGAVITETIFGIAGFGRLTVDAVNQRDYALLQGVVLVAAAGYVIVNLAVDLAYSLLNPRIRVSGRPT